MPGNEHAYPINSRLNDKSFRQNIYDKYSPIVYFHEKMIARPDTFEQVVETSSLKVNGEVVIQSGLTVESLIVWYHANYKPGMNISLDPNDFSGAKDLSQVPCYAALSEEQLVMHHETTPIPVYALVIVQNYGSNPGYCENLCGKTGPGYHKGDVEHATFWIQKLTNGDPGPIIAARYARHGTYEGEIILGNKVPKQGTHPIIYPALHGHGAYYEPGVQWRLFGVGNDITAKTNLSCLYQLFCCAWGNSSPGAITWRPKLSEKTDILSLNMDEGDGHVNLQKDYMPPGHDVTVSSTFWTRILALGECYSKFSCCFNTLFDIHSARTRDYLPPEEPMSSQDLKSSGTTKLLPTL